VKQVPCPRCGQPTLFAPQNKWRPFCSERCKLIDLGDWASERYRVAAEDKAPDSDEDAEMPREGL
jgi:endogenous inhibitor of DNA gyrase (YacG/DUF329 family)